MMKDLNRDVRRWLRLPLIIAAAVIVGRIVLERLGAPVAMTNLFGVVWLYFIVPFVLVGKILATGGTRP